MSEKENDSKFYQKGKNFWDLVPATVDGMLGGFSELSSIDTEASKRFLSSFINDKIDPLETDLALDCGAGIGRVTKHLLLHHFKQVDMVEQNQAFLNQAEKYIGKDFESVGNLICSGLQDFESPPETYNAIWCQWVTGHLTDVDFIAFLKRCKLALKKGGMIFVKDNLSSGDQAEEDNQDSSLTRPRAQLVSIFERAELTIVAERKQYKFPKGLYEVKMFALR